VPIIGYVCPPGGEEPGRQNDVNYCLTQCKDHCVTPPLLAAMWKADTGNYHQGDYISASMLAGSGCSRQVMLERYQDFYDLPTKRYWPFRGTHAHAIVEGAADIIAPFGWLQEIRMSTQLAYPLAAPVFDEHGQFTGDYDSSKDLVITVRGTCDAYNPITRTLVDCKSMADKKVEMMIKGSTPGTWSKNLQDSWIAQLNIYRFLIARTPIPDEVHTAFEQYGLKKLKGKTFPSPTKLYIQGIAMMSHPVSGARIAHKERGKVTLYDLDNVPVWTISDIEDYIRPRALSWYRALNLKQTPPVVPADKSWLCKNCAFYNSACFPEKERENTTEDTNE
jgi:hypothetical protein